MAYLEKGDGKGPRPQHNGGNNHMTKDTDTQNTPTTFDMMTAHGIMHCTLTTEHGGTQSK